MGSPPPKRRRRWSSLAGLAALGAATAVLSCAAGRGRLDAVTAEAAVVEGVCQHVLDNTTVGRQALVSSVWHPPLPVVLRLPLVACLGSELCPLPSLIVSLFFGMLCLAILHRILRTWGVGPLRWLVLAALALNPQFIAESFDGSSGTTVLALVLVTVYGLAEWVGRRQIRHLMYAGGGVALTIVTSFEVSLWLMAAFPILLANEIVRGSRRDENEATLILALTPVAYVLGLWILLNWLIMGDGLYFLRSLFAKACPREPLSLLTPLAAPYGVAAAAALGVTASSRRRADPRGMCVGAMGVAALAGLVLLAPRGLAWIPPMLWLCVFGLAVLAIGYALGASRGTLWRRRGLALLPLLVTAGAATLQPRSALPPSDTYGRMVREREAQFPRLASHVLRRARYVKVFACGYDSFRLLPPRADPVFLPALDFNFNKAKDDYRGQTLFVLVRRPEGRGAMDSIHWKFPGIHALGTRSTLYEEDWGDWRLFEIIEPSPLRPR